MTEPVDLPWLHGWPVVGPPRVGWADSVLIGTAVCCIGCGLTLGITTVSFPEDWDPPPQPDWPFPAALCPVHQSAPPEPAADPQPRARLDPKRLP